MALTTVPAAGAKLRASVLAALINERTPLVGLKTSDQNVGPSDTTLQDVTEVAVAVVANATYEFMLAIQYATNTTADIKFGFTFPAGLTMDYAAECFNSAETWVTTRGIQTTPLSMGGTGTSAVLVGTVDVAGTAGTLQLQAAQNTSNASTTNVEIGTILRLNRID